MNIICCVVVTCIVLWTKSQARTIADESNKLWQPVTGSREEWFRCHGVPCDQWHRTEEKLSQLKSLARANEVAFDGQASLDDSDLKDQSAKDTLDGCTILTGEQVVEVLDDQRNAMQGRRKRATTYKTFQKWTDMPIVWKFDGTHDDDEKAKLRGAFQHWMEHTCIRFREVETHDSISTNHILVTGEGGICSSNVGMVNRIPQTINLPSACLRNFGTPVHEIGHALGLWHEQQRWDRDDNIKVIKENIGYYGGQFLKVYNTDTSLPYDFGSVMHYGPKAGSKNRGNTMETLNPLYQHNMGQRTGLSYLDAKSINLAYCKAACPNHLAQPCQRDGYQDPNHCSRCRCPEGFSGTYCHEVEPAVNAVCGGVLKATYTPQYIKSPGYDTEKHYANDQQCNWLIQAPANHRVVLNFEGEFGIYCHASEQCHHWLEVRTGTNLGRQGARFCCYRTPKDVLRSEAGDMALIFRTNWTVPWNTAKRGFNAIFVAEPIDGHVILPIPKRTTTAPTTTTSPTTTTITHFTTKPTTTKSTTTESLVNPPIWRCSFEDDDGEKTLCGMKQSTSDQFDWTLQSGPTPSEETGPSSAPSGSQKYYIFIEASSPRRFGDTATITVPRLHSRGAHCVTFHYHMYGFHVNQLSLARRTSSGEQTTVWRQKKNHGDKWFSASVDVSMETNDELAFFGVVGHEYSGDIALDDLKVMKGSC